jgi:hypothetical protein
LSATRSQQRGNTADMKKQGDGTKGARRGEGSADYLQLYRRSDESRCWRSNTRCAFSRFFQNVHLALVTNKLYLVCLRSRTCLSTDVSTVRRQQKLSFASSSWHCHAHLTGIKLRFLCCRTTRHRQCRPLTTGASGMHPPLNFSRLLDALPSSDSNSGYT